MHSVMQYICRHEAFVKGVNISAERKFFHLENLRMLITHLRPSPEPEGLWDDESSVCVSGRSDMGHR